MGAGSSVNIERVQIQNDKLIRTNMSVVPIQIGQMNTNLQTVHKSETEIPKGSLSDSEFQMLPAQVRKDMVQNNVQTMMNRETRGNEDYELIDMSEEGVIRATGDGVVPIVQILSSMSSRNRNKYDLLNDVDNYSRQFHLRASPFGRMVNPLFETGERIHALSRSMQQNMEPNFVPITESEIEKLETVKDTKSLTEDCSICLEEINKIDIPEQKHILNSKNLEQIKTSLKERGIKFNDKSEKHSLIDILWNNRTKPNYYWKVKKLGCGHMFHINCLKNWFKNKDNCPNCRFKIEREKL